MIPETKVLFIILNPIIPDAKKAGYARPLLPKGTSCINDEYANPAMKMKKKKKIICQSKNAGLIEIVKFLFTSLMIGYIILHHF